MPREKPFAVAYWCSSVRKDIDISSFNQFFDFIVSIFKAHDGILKRYECYNTNEFKALSGDSSRRMVITVRSKQSCCFYINPAVINKILDVCDEMALYYFCDFGHNEEAMEHIDSKLYIEASSVKERIIETPAFHTFLILVEANIAIKIFKITIVIWCF